MKDLIEELISVATAKGICDEGLREMGSRNRDALINYYIANPDWCLERDFPDFDTLKDKFADCEGKGVYVDKVFHGETLNDLQTYIFHGCKGTIKVGLNVDKGIIPMLYLANGCRLRIIGIGDKSQKRRSEVPVYVFGKNDVSARNNQFVSFTRYNSDLI